MNRAISSWTAAALALAAAVGCGVAVKGTPGDDGGAQLQAAATPDTAPETSGGHPAAETVPATLLGSWTLTALDGRAVPDAGKTPTLEILEDGAVSGVSGVNRYRSNLEMNDGRLTFGPAVGTKMAGPPEAMDLETAFLSRLAVTSSYEIDGDTLRLWAGDNEALTFTRTVN